MSSTAHPRGLVFASVSVLLLGAAIGLSVATRSSAQEEAAAPSPSFERFSGSYVYDGTPEDGARRVRRAIQPAIANLNVLVRGMAEERLRERARVAREIRIEVRRERISVRYVDGERSRAFTSQAGETRRVQAQDGREARMVQRFREGHLEQVFTGERGRIYNLFELAEEGRRLHFSMVMTGERLERPIRIRLPYRRAP